MFGELFDEVEFVAGVIFVDVGMKERGDGQLVAIPAALVGPLGPDILLVGQDENLMCR